MGGRVAEELIFGKKASCVVCGDVLPWARFG